MFTSPSSHHDASSATDASEMHSLQSQIADLSRDVAKLVEVRARQVRRAAGQATDAARDSIEDYPLASVAGAFALGAVVGLLLTEGRSATPRSRLEAMRDDLSTYADDLRRSLSRSARDYSLSDRFEKMASALSSTDAKETIAPAFERVLGWLGQARDQAKSAVDAATAKVTG